VPVDFLTEGQRASYGRYQAVQSRGGRVDGTRTPRVVRVSTLKSLSFGRCPRMRLDGRFFVNSQLRKGAKTMTDKNNFADGTREHAADGSPPAYRAPGRRRWTEVVMHRWPTWLAIAMAAVLAPGTTVGELANALPLLAFGYLAAAALQRRRATWLLAVGVVAAYAALRMQDLVDPLVVLVAAAIALVLWGALRGQLRRGALVIEAAGMVGFTAISLAAVSADPELGRWVVAAGWFGHAAWDFAHLRADKVVSRSFAEWCFVFDVLRAIAILVLPVG
jgi:hypothetical protein